MKLKCPDCRESFKWDAQKAWPRFCPLCGEDINNDRDEIVMPFVSRPIHKTADRVYREMEVASEARVHQAAEMAGTSASEMSGLRITNLQDGRREGEIHAPKLPDNEVTRIMQQAGNVTGFGAQNNGVEYGAAVQSGPSPNAGAKMRTFIQNNHFDTVSKAGLPTKSINSEMPARETMQPGYIRRG